MSTERLEIVMKLHDQMSQGMQKIKGETTGVTTQMGKFDKGVEGVTRGLSRMNPLMSTFVSLGVGAAAAMAARGFWGMSVEVHKARDATLALHNATGVAVETLSAMDHVAKLNKTSTEGVSKAMSILARNMDGAGRGLKEQEQAFARLGIEIHDVNGSLRDIEDVFFELPDALNRVTSDTERLALQQQILGRGSMELSSMMRAGSDALREQAKEARELGVVFDKEAAVKSQKFNDELQRLRTAMSGIRQQFVEANTDWLISFIGHMQKAAEAVGWLAQGVVDTTQDIAKLGRRIGTIFTAEETKELNKYVTMMNTLGKQIKDVESAMSEIASNPEEYGLTSDEQLTRLAQAGEWYDTLIDRLRTYDEEYRAIGGTKGNPLLDAIDGNGSSPAQAIREEITAEKELAEVQKEKIVRMQEDWQKTRQRQLEQGQAFREQVMDEKFATMQRQAAEEERKEAHEQEMERRRQAIEELAKENKERNRSIELERLKSDAVMNTASAIVDSLRIASSENKKFNVVLKTAMVGKAMANAYLAYTTTMASLPPPYNVIAAKAVFANTALQANEIRKGSFADGGIYRSSSSIGDKSNANLNDREMVLNLRQQENMMRLLSGHGGAGGGGGVTVNISGNVGMNEQKLALLVTNALAQQQRTGQPRRL